MLARVLSIALAAAIAAAGCTRALPAAPTGMSTGGAHEIRGITFPEFAGPVDLHATTWDRIVDGDVPPLTNNKAGFLVAAFPTSADASISLNYLFSPATRNLWAAAAIDLEFEIVTTGAPQFQHDGGPGAPPSVRAFFWAYDLADDDYGSGRWWSREPIALAPGTFATTLSLDPSLWSNVDGQVGSDIPETLALSRQLTVAVGVTFGGGSSFGHGVSVTGGTADFVLKKFEIRNVGARRGRR